MVWNSDAGTQPNDSARIAALEATVADLQRRLAALESSATAGAQEPQAGDNVDPWSVAPWPEIVGLIQRGKKIEAIKVYRANFGVGLKEAKDAIDEVERRLGG